MLRLIHPCVAGVAQRPHPHLTSVTLRSHSLPPLALPYSYSSSVSVKRIIPPGFRHQYTKVFEPTQTKMPSVKHQPLPPSYIAVQHFGQTGRQRRFALKDDDDQSSSAPSTSLSFRHPRSQFNGSFVIPHTLEEDRAREAEMNEQHRLLQAIFRPYSKHHDEDQPTHTPAPNRPARSFSPILYPLASLLGHFLPKHFPSSVQPSYLHYSKYMFIASICGTASSVLSMQCLLLAVGLGATTALPTAAAINWVLKDGLGQMGGMLFASMVATRFDIRPLRYRLLASILLDLSILLEILTPLFPTLFLPLAALANIGKNIAWLSASASRASIHRSLIKRENLADVTAKSGSQTILASLFGTGLGIVISLFTGSNTLLILIMFTLLSTGHIFTTYKSLTRIVINQIHQQRLNTLSRAYIRQYIQQTQQVAPSSYSHPSFTFTLPTPTKLQGAEPIFWSHKKKVPFSLFARKHPFQFSSACSSSTNTQPRFEELVQYALTQPSLQLTLDDQENENQQSHISTHSLYQTWLAQFDSLPFIASFQLSEQPPELTSSSHWLNQLQAAIMTARNSGVSIKSMFRSTPHHTQNGADYTLAPTTPLHDSHLLPLPSSSVNPLASSSPVHLHLHLRLLFTSSATSDDLLRASLYTNFIRSRWESEGPAIVCAYHQQNENGSRSSSSSIHNSMRQNGDEGSAKHKSNVVDSFVRELHIQALELMKWDSQHALTHTPPASQVIPIAPFEVSTPVTSSSASAATPTSHSQSRFLSELRAVGFQLEHHFVEDENQVRITINKQEEIKERSHSTSDAK